MLRTLVSPLRQSVIPATAASGARTIGTSTENPRGFTPCGQEAPISDSLMKFYKYAQTYHGSSPPRVLITGGLGQLGRSLAAIMK